MLHESGDDANKNFVTMECAESRWETIDSDQSLVVSGQSESPRVIGRAFLFTDNFPFRLRVQVGFESSR